VLEVLAGLPVTVRLLDFTNDKTPPFLAGRLGASPLDALLQDSAALDAQLQAILSAAGDVRLSIMLPMVTRADQLTAVRERVRLAAAVVGAPRRPRLGAMVELPGAVGDAAALAAVSDFLSIGTNDLTAATLTLTRTDPRLSPASVADARVLSLVARTVAAARAAGVPVSVCGDAAADPVGLPALLGVGIRAISVSASRVAEVRDLVHQQSVGRAANGRTVPEPGGGPVSRLVAGGRHG
jgi:phosphoenolpyruvate-protein kinase (PTS system EI component)